MYYGEKGLEQRKKILPENDPVSVFTQHRFRAVSNWLLSQHLAQAFWTVGGIHRIVNEFAVAADYIKQAIAIFREQYGKAFGLLTGISRLPVACVAGNVHRTTADALNSLGLVYKQAKQYGQATEAYREALETSAKYDIGSVCFFSL